jgi:hypothetical protein
MEGLTWPNLAKLSFYLESQSRHHVFSGSTWPTLQSFRSSYLEVQSQHHVTSSFSDAKSTELHGRHSDLVGWKVYLSFISFMQAFGLEVDPPLTLKLEGLMLIGLGYGGLAGREGLHQYFYILLVPSYLHSILIRSHMSS